MKRIVPAALACAAAQACAPPPGPPVQASASREARQCFDAGAVDGFHAADAFTLDLKTGGGRLYRVALIGDCDAEWAHQVSVQPWSGSGRVCPGAHLDVVAVAPGTGARRCSARAVGPLPGPAR